MDPGNWADIAGGSQFGYSLLWVLLMSNIMVLLLQSLSSTWNCDPTRFGTSFPTYSPFINYILYFLAEVAIAACDLAEVLGMAIGINLLFDIPLSKGYDYGFGHFFIIVFE
jgi:manganese transport protein